MHNIDFISEKWRTCRRTRRLAHIHLASSIFPIIYVAVYAEAQRRDGDNKELGAALAALMFNVFQMMRTIMGLVQLNAFVAWCNHAVDCMNALQGHICPVSEKKDGRGRDEPRRMIQIVRHGQNVFISWCKYTSQRARTLLRGDSENSEQCRNEEENIDPSLNEHGSDRDGSQKSMGVLPRANRENSDADSIAEANEEALEIAAGTIEDGNRSCRRSSERRNAEEEIPITVVPQQNTITSVCNRVSEWTGRRQADDGDQVEDVVMVNNMVVDNELGGREVTVLPSLKKMWSELKEGRFTPSKWLRTDRVILNTIRWGGAYLCGVGADWSAHVKDFPFDFRDGTEILESFFSREMENVRNVLQHVEWDLNAENDRHELLSIHQCGDDDIVDLTGEMSTAYGNHVTSYVVSDTSTVGVYSYEFNSLVSSYPASKKFTKSANRERIVVGLVHSVLLAKHLGVQKLHAIGRYYDEHRLPRGNILRNAFKLLLLQTNTLILNDSKIWEMFDSFQNQIPIFPYRMQMVALWDQATNWRVLQASAYQDIQHSIDNSRCLKSNPILIECKNETVKQVGNNARSSINIFDYCTKWTREHIDSGFGVSKGSLGVVMETVRTFLAEWITRNHQEPNWRPEIPTASVEFDTKETTEDKESWYLIWICQRELQRKVARMLNEEENLPGNTALIMLFILGSPLLEIGYAPDAESSASSCSDTHRSIDMNVDTWRVWTPLSPQDISLIIRCDSDSGAVSLQMRNDSRDTRFMWQDWVDAGMGCMKGFEECKNGGKGYARKIVRVDLRKPMVELCPLYASEPGMDEELRRTSTARLWTGWPTFDLRIAKFEVDQWHHACNVDIREYWVSSRIPECLEGVMNAMISADT